MATEDSPHHAETSFTHAAELNDIVTEPEREITLDDTWYERYGELGESIEDILDRFEEDLEKEARVREPQVEQHDLKDMTVDELFNNLIELGSEWNEEERAMVARAYRLAADLHQNDRHRDKPYVYHLLRNANRAACYLHVTDSEIIAAIILHDSVEDHAGGIVALPSASDIPRLKVLTDERSKAYAVLQKEYSPRVARIIEGMSNPLPLEGLVPSDDDKITSYINHVAEAIVDPDVWVAKVVDWGDNGLGLVHSDLDTSTGRGAKLMRKYWGVSHALEARYRQADIQAMLEPVAKLNVEHMFDLGRERLYGDRAA